MGWFRMSQAPADGRNTAMSVPASASKSAGGAGSAVRRNRNTSSAPLASLWPATRLVAPERKATKTPSALIDGVLLWPPGVVVGLAGVWETRVTTPVARVKRNRSSNVFVSDWPVTRLVAADRKATNAPSALTVEDPLPLLAAVVVVAGVCETSVSAPVVRA